MLYSILRFIAAVLFKVFFRIEVEGRENIPSQEGFIIASNHLSNLDPIVLGVASPRKLHFLAKEELFKISLFSFLISRLGALPLKRRQADVSALKESIKKLNQNQGLVIFPEGSRLNREKKVYAGVGFLINKTKVKVVPSKIYNTDKVLPPGKIFPCFRKIRVVFGRPLIFSSSTSEEITSQIIKEIKSL